MRLLSSLRSRIFLTSALLAVLSIGAAIYRVNARVTGEAEQALHREIAATGALVEQLRATRAETFTVMSRLIADTPKLKAAVSTDDPATVQSPLQDIAKQNRLETNLFLVTNKAGKVLATYGVGERTALIIANQPSIRQAIAGRETFSLLPQPNGMMQLVTVPILGPPDILGTLSVGFLLDETLAAQLKTMTGSEIAFGMDGQILATTLPAGDRGRLGPLLRDVDGSKNVTIGGEEYVALLLPLSSEQQPGVPEGGPVALILRSRTEHLRFLSALHRELEVTAILALLLATLLSFAVARTITRPLADITSAMREMSATGDLTRKILLRGDRRWDDEDAQLLATTFNTLTDSIARFQREISQRERLSSLGRLSTVIAHEVRNPLMIIKTVLHTLRQPDLGAAAVGEAARDIDEEVGRLNRIVNDVLDFGRPIAFELSPADLNAVCRESAAAAQATPGPAVVLNLDPALPLLTTDAERLRLALVNLIVNARQSVDARTAAAGATAVPPAESLGVRVSTRATNLGVTIAVADTGAGIGAADLPRVFDPYFTTKRGGTGLGLPIAKNIIEGLNGVISITSTPGRGTEIRIDIPVTAPGPGTVQATAVSQPDDAGIPHAGVAAGPLVG
jgi:signal transduction histidine kinase